MRGQAGTTAPRPRCAGPAGAAGVPAGGASGVPRRGGGAAAGGRSGPAGGHCGQGRAAAARGGEPRRWGQPRCHQWQEQPVCALPGPPGAGLCAEAGFLLAALAACQRRGALRLAAAAPGGLARV